VKDVSFLEVFQEFENPENVSKFTVLNDLMHSAYSTTVSQLFTKRLHHRNISLVLITQNVFHQCPSSRDISQNIIVF